MSEEPPPTPREPEGATPASADEELSEAELAQLDATPAVSTLLKRSMRASDDLEPNANAQDAHLLESVQRRIRKRSKGKFYGDGWSTTQSRLNYALIAALMLVTIVAVWLALGPTGFTLR
jgi:hypothetical protein